MNECVLGTQTLAMIIHNFNKSFNKKNTKNKIKMFLTSLGHFIMFFYTRWSFTTVSLFLPYSQEGYVVHSFCLVGINIFGQKRSRKVRMKSRKEDSSIYITAGSLLCRLASSGGDKNSERSAVFEIVFKVVSLWADGNTGGSRAEEKYCTLAQSSSFSIKRCPEKGPSHPQSWTF